MNKILKLALVLFLVCAITAGILGGIYNLTKDTIQMRKDQKEAQAFATVLASESYEKIAFDEAENPTIVSINKADNGSGWVVVTEFSGAQGTIEMAVGVNTDYECTGIFIISHSETSGLGAVAASSSERGASFRNSFVGKGADITLNDIDAITGATITSKAVTNAVAKVIAMVQSVG